MKKSGFTLVEILIVVVIIGILSAAILPRFSGYMEKVRDLKRQSDMRNISIAIESYRNSSGKLPFSETAFTIYPATELKPYLGTYLSAIPKDPHLSSQQWLYGDVGAGSWLFNNYPHLRKIKGEYIYWKMLTPKKEPSALLIAKVETPDLANYVRKTTALANGQNGGTLRSDIDGRFGRGHTIDSVMLCDQISKKVPKGAEQVATATNKECSYSSVDQLYYLIKFE